MPPDDDTATLLEELATEQEELAGITRRPAHRLRYEARARACRIAAARLRLAAERPCDHCHRYLPPGALVAYRGGLYCAGCIPGVTP